MNIAKTKCDIVPENLSAQSNETYLARLCRRAKDLLLDELYGEFVPRWYKKKPASSGSVKAVPEWILPSLKIGVGASLYPLSTVFGLGDYETVAGAIGLYLAADGVYQFIDMMSPYSKGRGEMAATILVDIVSYPFYLISSKVRR